MMKNIIRSLGAAALLSLPFGANAQELRCDVEVNSQSIEGTNTSVFESLQTSLKEYVNNTKFSNATFSAAERIDCRIFLTIAEYADDRMKGTLQLQLSRPVYNSSYTSTVFNFKDSRVEFTYRDGDPLIFSENTHDNNLLNIIDFYCYLFLALDFDTFSAQGGQPFYDRAATIVQAAQSSGEAGWKAFEDTKNRSSVLSSYTDGATSAMRQLLYDYHRKGLDEMVTSPDKGRAVITESLKQLSTIYRNAPMSVALSIFRDSKLDELVNIYSQAPQTERDAVYEILSPIYPTDTERLDKIRKGDESL